MRQDFPRDQKRRGEVHAHDALPIGRIFERRERPPGQPRAQLRQLLQRACGQRAEARRILRLADQLQRLALPRHHNPRRHLVAPQQTVIDLAPLDRVPALALQFTNPVPHLVEVFREGARIRSLEP